MSGGEWWLLWSGDIRKLSFNRAHHCYSSLHQCLVPTHWFLVVPHQSHWDPQIIHVTPSPGPTYKSSDHHWIFLLEGCVDSSVWMEMQFAKLGIVFQILFMARKTKNVSYGFESFSREKFMHMLFWNRAICFEIIWVWPRRLLPINSNNLKWYANFIKPIFIKN